MPRRSSAPRTCAFPECGRRVKARGYCNGHYQQAKAGRELKPLQKKHRPDGSVAGEALCNFPGCAQGAASWGLCDGHYQQKRAGKELTPLQVIHEVCTVPRCGKPHEAHGYCGKHYERWRAGKDPEARSRKDPSHIEDRGNHLAVMLTGKWAKEEQAVALVSLEDRDLVEGRTWRMNEDGYAAGRDEENRHIGMHRVILGLAHGDPLQGDHINGDRLDNRRKNLRVCTQAQNAQNKKVWGSSGHRNIYQHSRTKRYRVAVRKNGKLHYGGRHKELDDAIEAARALREKLFSHANEDRAKKD